MRPDLPPCGQAKPTKVEDVQANIRSSIVNSGATCHVCGCLFVDTHVGTCVDADVIHTWRPRDDAATSGDDEPQRLAATSGDDDQPTTATATGRGGDG